MLRRFALIPLLTFAVTACSSGSDAANASNGAANAVDTTAALRAVARAGGRVSLDSATTFEAQTRDPVLSSVVKPGDIIEGAVTVPVFTAEGNIVIDALSPLKLRVVRIERRSDPAATSGRVEFAVDSLVMRDRTIALSATVGPVASVVMANGIVLVDRGTRFTVTLTKRLSIVQPKYD
ncbi:MAG: hypothetical protein O2973_08050 [Gemmatimonadetes bacterium]|nr:hypothetical protein [Gemmatimonadota bacterium]